MYLENKLFLKLSYILCYLCLVTISACSPGSSPTPPPSLSSEKKINAVLFKTADNPGLASNVAGVINGDTIKVLFQAGTVLTNLIPEISFTGRSLNPANRVAQNFTNPVSYTVTAEDGSTKIFVVLAKVETADATLYINSRNGSGVGSIYAINPYTGNLKWKYISTSGSLVSSIQFSNGVLFTGIGRNITAFDTVTKSVKWQYLTGGVLYSTPTIKNGIVYINCDDNFLYAVNELTGTLLWKYQQDAPSSPGGNYSSPTVVDDVVYFGSLNGYIYAVNVISGVLKWKTLINAGSSYHSSPSVVNNVLYIVDLGGLLIALNINDGSVKWLYGSGGAASSPTFVNGVVYMCSSGGRVLAIDANSGTLIWRYDINLLTDASPIVSNGVLYVGAGGGSLSTYFYAINTNNGTLKWSTKTDQGYFSSAVVFDNTVYVGTWPEVLAFNTNTGLLKWKFTPPSNREEFWPSPCIVDQQGNVYLSSISGSKD
jgi:eukaryotic-like serine/threonine-protein kinase